MQEPAVGQQPVAGMNRKVLFPMGSARRSSQLYVVTPDELVWSLRQLHTTSPMITGFRDGA